MSTDLCTTAPSSDGVPANSPHLSPASTDHTAFVARSSPPPVRTITDRLGQSEKMKKVRRARAPKAPKDSKIYKVCMAVVALRAQGKKGKEVADILGYPVDTISTYMKRGVKQGWLTMGHFDDPDDQLDLILRNKTVRNINELLDDRDKEVTIEAAKGLGMFKAHQVVKGDVSAQMGLALRVQVELPPSVQDSRITVRPGTIGGAQAGEIPIDAEVIGDGEDRERK